MKTIIHIFINDVKGLSKNIFALVIAIGLCIIPSLYAWFNIYSNWDPYANTSAIEVAVVSEDEGYKTNDTTTVVMGDEVIEQLHDNQKIGWVFPDSSDEAIEGVKSGKYYAALVIGTDFSFSLYDFLNNGYNHPSITYYENSKKNAVANKITDTGASSLQQNINKEFIEVVVKTAMTDLNSLTPDDYNILLSLINDFSEIQNNLSSYNSAIDTFIASNNQLSNNLINIYNLIPEVKSTIESTSSTTDVVSSELTIKINGLQEILKDSLPIVQTNLVNIQDSLGKAAETSATDLETTAQYLNDVSTSLGELIKQIETLSDSIDDLTALLPDQSAQVNEKIKNSLIYLNATLQMTQKIVDYCSEMALNSSSTIQSMSVILKPVIDDCFSQISVLNETYFNNMSTSLDTLLNTLVSSLDAMKTTLNNSSNSLDNIGQILLSSSKMIKDANQSLSETKIIINSLTIHMSDFINQLNTVNESSAYETLMGLLNADAEAYAQFLSEPVKVTQIDVYNAANYGTSVTPFYTTLALWVGAIILVALIKCNVDYKDTEFKSAKPHEKYFGRLILFLLMGQLQAVIVVLGDLYLLKIQCVHPVMFFIASSIASFVFTLLIYTLTLSFGDVGKALAVVMVVLQIAGSSGTYPIELLPDFFKTIYLYFPFPYAINAMREAISGLYRFDYAIYLCELLIFAVASLLLGLLVRLPFVQLNHFFEKRMKDTDLM